MKKIVIGETIKIFKPTFRRNKKKGLVIQFLFVTIGILLAEFCFVYSFFYYIFNNNITPIKIIGGGSVIIIIGFFSYIFIMFFGWYAIPLIRFNNIKYNNKYILLPWYKGILNKEIVKYPIEEIRIIRYNDKTKNIIKKMKNYSFIKIFFPFLLGEKTYFKKCIILMHNEEIYFYPKRCLSNNYKFLYKEIEIIE